MSPCYWVSEQMQGHRSCLKVCGRAGERKAGEARVAEEGAGHRCGQRLRLWAGGGAASPPFRAALR